MPAITLDTPGAPDAVLTETDALFRSNMETVRACWPELFTRLAGVNTVHSTLVRDGEDDWNIEFRGERFYPKPSKEHAAEQVETYLKAPLRMAITPPQSSALERFSNSLLVRTVFRAQAEAAAVFTPQVAMDEGFHLVVFGVGLGHVLPELIKRTGAKHVILCEPHVEVLLHSMRCFDWKDFLNNPPHYPLQITWLLTEEPELLGHQVRDMLRVRNVARIDGSYWFQHYPNAKLAQARQRMEKDMALAFSGLGYLDDELKMIRNSYNNLKDQKPLLFRHGDAARSWPIFVIGSGPSLEKDFEHIRRNADKAIIIACGTALRPLLKEGIRPDFFAELENGEPIYNWIALAKEQFGFEGITLLASDTVDGRLKDLFDNTLFFVRPGLSNTNIFGHDKSRVLSYVFPTVGNTGLSFALHTGFREIYFFGMDLGSRHAKHHHASETPYGKVEGLPTDVPFTNTVPGNFGGTIHTEYVFNWGRDTIERTIMLVGRARRIFNCSDGALIQGTTPKLAATLNLPKPATSRDVELAALNAPFSPYGEEEFAQAWEKGDVVGRVTAMRDSLIEACRIDEDEPLLTFVDRMAAQLVAVEEHTNVAHTLFRGTMLMALISCAFYVSHTASDEARKQVAAICVEEAKLLLEQMTDHIVECMRQIEETGYCELPVS